VSSVVVEYLLGDAGFFLVFGKIGEIPGLMVGVVLFCTLVVKVIPGRIPDAVAATAKISLRISSYPGSLPPLLLYHTEHCNSSVLMVNGKAASPQKKREPSAPHPK